MASGHRWPLTDLSGRPRSTSSFLNHLKRFADRPLYILDTRGEGRKTRYRFRDPLMKPFVMMKGLNDGVLKFPMVAEDDEFEGGDDHGSPNDRN